jgi:hypothetical protein
MPRPADRPDRASDLDQAGRLRSPVHSGDRRLDMPSSASRVDQRLSRLPDGHPSSPYSEDWSRRAPVTRLRDLAIPGDEPGTRAWYECLPGLKDRWEQHLERWPDQPATEERHVDEPGSWRGDSGSYLSPAENAVTDRALSKARDAADAVTGSLQQIEGEFPGVRLAGLGNCCKGENRFKEKVAENLSLKPERDAAQEAASVPDALRYTYVLPPRDYTAGYRAISQRMQDQGHVLTEVRNFWSSEGYKGINSRWSTADDQRFEVQFHTEVSFQAKELTHEAYERIRDTRTSKAELGELRKYQELVTSYVQVPDGAREIAEIKLKRTQNYG